MDAAACTDAMVPTGLAGLWAAVQMAYWSAKSEMRLASSNPPNLGMSRCTPSHAWVSMSCRKPASIEILAGDDGHVDSVRDAGHSLDVLSRHGIFEPHRFGVLHFVCE